MPNVVTVEGFHHSGRFDRTPESFAASIERMRKGRSFGTRTEVGNKERARQLIRNDDWNFYRPVTPFGPADCSVEWDTGVWEVRHTYWLQLTKIRVWTRGGFHLPPTIAVFAVLEHVESDKVLVVASLHRNLRNTELRRDARASEARTLNGHLRQIRAAHPNWSICVSYDENSNQRFRTFRRIVRETILRSTGMRNLRGQHAKHTTRDEGTWGRSILDTTLSTEPGSLDTKAQDASSDHKPYAITLRLGARWPK